MKTKKPTKKQAAILQFIEAYTEEHEVSPSYREIMAALRLRSVSAVAEHINNCVAAGFLEKLPNQARTLRVIPAETHEETIKFFNQKIAELTREVEGIEDRLNAISGIQISLVEENAHIASQEASEEKISPQMVNSLHHQHKQLEEQIGVLKRAASILEIDL